MTDEDILEAIRGRHFVAAKREIATKLKRFPSKNYYLVLNAFYLFKTGSTKQALEECGKVRAKIPSDIATLDLLHEIYSLAGCKNEACQVYEAAAKKYPTANLLSNWYNKSMELFDAHMMQKSAKIMRDTFPKNRAYHLKSVFANIIWSEECQSEDESGKLLDSALSVMKSLEPLESNQEAFLYGTLLMKVQDYIKAIEVLEVVKNKELELILLFLEALDKAQQWEKLFSFSHDLLFKQSFNDYTTWKYLIKAGHALKKPYEEIKCFVKFDTRNSFVANMEISRVFEHGFDDAIEKYFERFMSKPCCGIDLSGFELPASFLERVQSRKSEYLEKSKLSDDEKAICVNIEKILSNSCGSKVEWSAYEKFDSPELADLYLASMLQSASEDLSTSRVFEHIIKLEKYAETDAENFNIKLWLLNLYSTICGSTMALRTYDDLKIKMIQHDTLTYKLNLEPSVRNLNHLIKVYRFYLTGDKEIAVYFGKAMITGLFTKLRDLFRFGKRLKTSLSRHLVILQISKMCRMLNSDYSTYFQGLIQDAKYDILCDEFEVSDNRDFNTDYNLGFKFDENIFFSSEKKKNKNYVQLQYLKEIIIAGNHGAEVENLLKTFEKWLGDPSFTNTLSASETHFCRLLLAVFKLTQLASTKNQDSQMNYLAKNLDFKKIEQKFLSNTSPLSNSAIKILVDTLDVSKLISSLSSEDKLTSMGRTFQQGLVRYIVTGPEMAHFKEIRRNLSAESSSPIEEPLDHLEDGIRTSKFKLK